VAGRDRAGGVTVLTATPGPSFPGAVDAGPALDRQLSAWEKAENFPVALRLLPRELRADLRAVYAVVRTIDQLGDAGTGDRRAALEAFRRDLATVWITGRPHSAVLTALVPTVERRGLPLEPFERLLAANLQDQRVARYERFADLLAYCSLSAAPIGRLVLAVFGAASPERIALSDRVCAGLQVVEHLQDVAEDRRAGRIYLPREDLAAHGVRDTDLDAASASPALRRLVAFELRRVTDLLDAGGPLLADLSGRARLAVAGYLAGGRAAADGIRRVDCDVLPGTPGVRRRDLARHLLLAFAPHRPSRPGAS
jgi:squalene synthase HpnC